MLEFTANSGTRKLNLHIYKLHSVRIGKFGDLYIIPNLAMTQAIA